MAEAFVALASALAERAADAETDETAELRRRTAAALDGAIQSGAQLRADQVDMQLLRPPWCTSRATQPFTTAGSVSEARRELAARRPEASALLSWLDARALALEPYRRLGEARHLPWASASVAASVAAVQRARDLGPPGRPPHVLISQGSLGAEAAAAASAGALVCCCEPNQFAAAAIREVADLHGVGHAVRVVERTIEDELAARGAARGAAPPPQADVITADVVVLTPLLEEAALGRRLLPAAAAAVASTARASVADEAPMVVPSHVHVRVALGLLTAGCVHGVDLTPLDATRWSAYPMPWAAQREEAAVLLSDYVAAFDLELAARGVELGASRELRLHARADLVEAANRATGDAGGAPSRCRCNAVLIDTAPRLEAYDGAPISQPPPQKRAVLFVEPFVVRAGESYTLHASHDGLRLSVSPPLGAPAAYPGRREGWGRLLLQHWHFAMVRDAPRNDAYAAAIRRAAAGVARRASRTGAPAAIDLGSGSGLLALMLAKELRACGGGGGGVLGVEIVSGVADLGRRCIKHNGAERDVSMVRAEGHALCAQAEATPQAERPNAALLVAELMDSGGLGEGLLPLAHAAVTSGLVGPGAQLLPCRLRVWAFAAELRASGSALDGAELRPSEVGGVSMGPWLRFHEMKSYSSMDLAAAEYTPLTQEVMLFDAVLGEPPPADRSLSLRVLADGVANAVVWTWEVDLDESGEPHASLSNAPRAPKTHWRQAAHLLVAGGRRLRAGDYVGLSYRAITGGRELRFELLPSTPGRDRAPSAAPPERTRPHGPRFTQPVPAEPPASLEATTTSSTPAQAHARTEQAASHRGGATRATAWRLSTSARGAGPAHSGTRSCSRSVEAHAYRARKPRAAEPLLGAHIAIDGQWKAAMERATRNAVHEFGLSPGGALRSVALCDAAMELAAHPSRYGVHPADALQGLRLYYAS